MPELVPVDVLASIFDEAPPQDLRQAILALRCDVGDYLDNGGGSGYMHAIVIPNYSRLSQGLGV